MYGCGEQEVLYYVSRSEIFSNSLKYYFLDNIFTKLMSSQPPMKPDPGVLKFSLAGANNSVPMTYLTPCIIIVHVYTCNYSGAEKNIDARWHSLVP